MLTGELINSCSIACLRRFQVLFSLMLQFECRKHPYRFEHHVRYSPEYVDFNGEITSSPISCGNTRYQTRLQIDEQNQFFELQRRLGIFQVAQRSLSSPPHLGLDTNGSRVSDGIDSIFEIIFRLTYLNLSIGVNTSEGLIKLLIQTKSNLLLFIFVLICNDKDYSSYR